MTEDSNTDQQTLAEAQALAMSEFSAILKDLLNRKDHEGIKPVYANYANFELSDLDLKIIFGQLSQQSGKRRADWHTAVTMPWAEAKLVSYFLRVNLAIYEAQHGIIKVPTSMMPTLPPPPSDVETNPTARKFVDAIQAIHNELLEDQTPLE